MKRIVFVTTCKGRAQHIALTLPKNLADNADYANAKFVILDYSSPDDLLPYLFAHHQSDMESGRLAVYSFLDPSPGPFRIAHAKNLAARCGILEGADILVTLDADNYTGEGFAQFIWDNFGPNRYLGDDLFMCPDFPLIHSLPHGPGRPQRGYAGRLAIRTQDFIKVGGYDEIYDVWGSEDMDMIFRLQRMGYQMGHIPNRYLNTIPHGADIRFKEYPEARKFENKRHVMDIAARTETVVNFGKAGMGKVRKYPTGETVNLGPFPTRIFGIGMHKTATSSLHKAFQILGYDSFHWGAGEAPRIWQEAKYHGTGRSKTLEQWYALSDNPIPLLYKNLDRAYPGSKFILTVRDERDWLESVKRLWDPRYNPTRWVWDKYPFTNHIHSVLYQMERPDPVKFPNVFLRIYRRHNAEVKEYFKDRPGDLLVLDIPAITALDIFKVKSPDHDWKELCGFLGIPIPDLAFPWKNHNQQRGGKQVPAESDPFVAAAAAIYGEPSLTEPDMKIQRRRRHHHHHHCNTICKWIRRVLRRWFRR